MASVCVLRIIPLCQGISHDGTVNETFLIQVIAPGSFFSSIFDFKWLHVYYRVLKIMTFGAISLFDTCMDGSVLKDKDQMRIQ